METLSMQQRRQRKFLLVLPLIVLPFITLLFWVLGGGKTNAANAQANQPKGFNTQLPDARLKNDSSLNKLSYYDRAAADSVKLKQQMKSDPYYHAGAKSDSSGLYFSVKDKPSWLQSSSPAGSNNPAANEAKIYQRLSQLQAVVNKSDKPSAGFPEKTTEMATLAAVPKNAAGTEDPELKQMNGLLEKILDIQHPERTKAKADSSGSKTENQRFKAIPAVIDGNQKIIQGTVIRLKLLDSVTIGGQLFPKGQLVYGSGDLYNQRFTLNIRSTHIGYQIFPVDLTVFDMTDGLEGINVPEAVTGDAVKEGALSGAEGVQFMSLDPSLTTQLAGAGLNMAKGLFSKKIKRIKAKLKDGHPLLLRDNTSFKVLVHH